jgi:hypothetical protein
MDTDMNVDMDVDMGMDMPWPQSLAGTYELFHNLSLLTSDTHTKTLKVLSSEN